MSKNMNLCILGAGEPIGRELINQLYQKGLPISSIEAVDKKAKSISTKDGEEVLKCKAFHEINFSAPSASTIVNVSNLFTKDNVADIWSAGSDPDNPQPSNIRVIDSSRTCAATYDIAAVVPSINSKKMKGASIFSSPHAISIAISVLLNALKGKIGKIHSVFVTGYQAMYYHGDEAIAALISESKKCFMNSAGNAEFFPYQIAFNCIPECGEIDNHGVAFDERRIISEVNYIVEHPVNVNLAAVPVIFGDSFFIDISCEGVNQEAIEKAIKAEKQLYYLGERGYMTPFASHMEEYIYVGRARYDRGRFSAWVCFDGCHVSARNLADLLLAECAK